MIFGCKLIINQQYNLLEFILTISCLFWLICNVCKFWDCFSCTGWKSACTLEKICFVLRCEVVEKAWFNFWAIWFSLIYSLLLCDCVLSWMWNDNCMWLWLNDDCGMELVFLVFNDVCFTLDGMWNDCPSLVYNVTLFDWGTVKGGSFCWW